MWIMSEAHIIVVLLAMFTLDCESLPASNTIRSTYSHVNVLINTDTIIHEVDEKYASLAIGASLIQHRWRTFDVTSVRLQTLARALSPAYLRLGGTWADFMTFVPDSRGQSNPSLKMEEVLKDPEYYESLDSYGWTKPKHITPFNMTGEDFEKINNFTKTVGFKFLFDHNVLKRRDGRWDPTNAKQILDYSIQHGYTANQLFELGNEPNSMSHAINFTLPPQNLSADFKQLRSVLNSPEYATYYQTTKLVGPDVTKGVSSVPYLDIFLQHLNSGSEHTIDAVTWHHYYLDGRTATVEDFLDPVVMDSLIPLIEKARNGVRSYMPPGTKIWYGETGSAFGGGAPNLSNTYAAGFLLLDKLGLSASMGLDVMLRQTLYGGHYAMIDDDLNPMPDYWLTLIFKVLVGTKVLKVTTSDDTGRLRLYSHCTNTERTGYPVGAVTLYGLNIHDEDVSIQMRGSLQNQVLDQFTLQPGVSGLTSLQVQVNGQVLKLVDEKTLPKIEPKRLAPGESIVVPANSFGFYVIPNAKAQACGHVSNQL